MKKLTVIMAFLAITFAVISCQSPQKLEERRKPASIDDLFTGVDKVLHEIPNDSIFNAQTCPTYINSITDYLYALNSDYFVPRTPAEVANLKAKGRELLKNIFQVRVILREKFQQFDERNELTNGCILKVREGIQYARITEEYLLEWLVHNKVIEERTPIVLAADPDFTLVNPKFQGFHLQTGDVMTIRGKSYVSAMIARIGDEEGNFSHLALVTEDSKGNQYIVEALIQNGVIITPLEKWRQAQDARVALFRQRDPELAKRAGRMMYDYARTTLDKKGEIRYDFAMNDQDYSSFFCSEVATFAYDKASEGKFIVPKYRSSLTKFKNKDYPRSLGVTKTTLFAPYDIEADPRFDFVAEYKFYPLLRQVRMQDAVLQSIYDWMIEKDYSFHFNALTAAKSYLGKFLRQFGMVKDVMPKYMPMQTVRTTAQFQAVATVLENNIYKKEAEYYKVHDYLPTFREFMAMNDDYRKEDCKIDQEYADSSNSINRLNGEVRQPNRSQFQWFFYSDNGRSCD